MTVLLQRAVAVVTRRAAKLGLLWSAYFGAASWRMIVVSGIAATLLLPIGAAQADRSAKADVRLAWDIFHAAYTDRAAGSLCNMLASSARAQLEDQMGSHSCRTAAQAWFAGPQYDAGAAVHARLLSVHIDGRYAGTVDSDANSPASQWIEEFGRWKLASFVLLG